MMAARDSYVSSSTFHLPHGEMSITLQDVEVLYGLPIEGEVLVGPTAWVDGD